MTKFADIKKKQSEFKYSVPDGCEGYRNIKISDMMTDVLIPTEPALMWMRPVVEKAVVGVDDEGEEIIEIKQKLSKKGRPLYKKTVFFRGKLRSTGEKVVVASATHELADLFRGMTCVERELPDGVIEVEGEIIDDPLRPAMTKQPYGDKKLDVFTLIPCE